MKASTSNINSNSNADLLGNDFDKALDNNILDDEDNDMQRAEGGGGGAITSFSKKNKVRPGSFESFNLSNPIFKAIKKKGYNMPTPIQRKAIPVIMEGFNVIAMARTGSGKTGAFVIPIVDRLK